MKADLMGELNAENAHQLIVEVQAASPRRFTLKMAATTYPELHHGSC
jgi:hypothetical protein